MTEQELKILAEQLSKPEGDVGKDVAKMMNETNITMTKESIRILMLSDGEKILEIGHGNAGHLGYLLDFADNLHYTGLEISKTMKTEAESLNADFGNQSEFLLYDGQNLPFQDDSFDKIFTVNTIYFWENPLLFMNEIYRILKKGGKFVLTFAKKDFMKTLPFTDYHFNLYNNEDLEELVSKSSFRKMRISDKEEWIMGKTGKKVERKYTISIINK